MITVEHITKTFNSGRGRLQALSGVSFTAEAGTATAIVGKSGSGKTTLLNCIGGLLRPDEGFRPDGRVAVPSGIEPLFPE